MPTERITPVTLDDTEVAELLFTAIGGDRSRLTTAVQLYRDNIRAYLLGIFVDEAIAGVAGYEVRRHRIALHHIATTEPRRRCGIGRRLLTEIRSRYPELAISAETDSASVGFYLSNGFTAISLGEKYPGVERFRVKLDPTKADT
jgi:GNAT superfamily N-acetyltransferase